MPHAERAENARHAAPVSDQNAIRVLRTGILAVDMQSLSHESLPLRMVKMIARTKTIYRSPVHQDSPIVPQAILRMTKRTVVACLHCRSTVLQMLVLEGRL